MSDDPVLELRLLNQRGEALAALATSEAARERAEAENASLKRELVGVLRSYGQELRGEGGMFPPPKWITDRIAALSPPTEGPTETSDDAD
jgi:hypothetical protein